VDEWTGKKLLDPGQVPAAITIRALDMVGRYALTFAFSDGHGTGIYSFDMLWKLCEQEHAEHNEVAETKP
jgi:DUF971 family protein